VTRPVFDPNHVLAWRYILKTNITTRKTGAKQKTWKKNVELNQFLKLNTMSMTV